MPWGMTGRGAGQPWGEPPVLPGNLPGNIPSYPSQQGLGLLNGMRGSVPDRSLGTGRTFNPAGASISPGAPDWRQNSWGYPAVPEGPGFFGRVMGSIGHGFGALGEGVRGLAGSIFNSGGDAGQVPAPLDPNSEEARTAAFVARRNAAQPAGMMPGYSYPAGSLLGSLRGMSPTAMGAMNASGNFRNAPSSFGHQSGISPGAAIAMGVTRGRNLP